MSTENHFSAEKFEALDKILTDLLKIDKNAYFKKFHEELSCDKSSKELQEVIEISNELLTIGNYLGTYEILEYLGHGGYGIVYKAICHETKRLVALKIPLRNKINNHDVRKRFEREAILTKMIDHPSHVKLIESGEINGIYFIVFEYFDAQNLKNWLKTNKNGLDLETILKLCIDILDVLNTGFLMGIVNRDLKPSNILVRENKSEWGKRLEFRLTDLGLGHYLLDDTLSASRSNLIVGTLQYMSPEQAISGSGRVDIRADLYALGLILGELIIKKPIRNVKSLSELFLYLTAREADHEADKLKGHVSRNLFAVIRKATRLNSLDRYQTPNEFRNDLENLMNNLPVSARMPTTLELVYQQLRRRPEHTVYVFLIIVISSLFVVNIIASNYSLRNLNKTISKRNNELVLATKSIELINKDLNKKQKSLEDSKYLSDIRLIMSEADNKGKEMVHELLDNLTRRDDFLENVLESVTSINYRSHSIIDFPKYLQNYRNKDISNIKQNYQNKWNVNHDLRFSFKNDEIHIYDDNRIYILNDNELLEEPIVIRSKFVFENVEVSQMLDTILGLVKINHDDQHYELVIYNRITQKLIRSGIVTFDLISKSKITYGISPDSKFCFIYDPRMRIILKLSTIDGKTIEILFPENLGIHGDILSIAINNNGDELLLGVSTGETVIVSKLSDWRVLCRYPTDFNVIHQVGYLDNSRIFVRIRYSDKIYILNKNKDDNEVQYYFHGDEVWSISLLDDKSFISAGDDHHIKLWDRRNSKMMIIGSMESLVTSTDLSPNRDLLAAGDFDGNIFIYETKNWNLIKKKRFSESKVEALLWLDNQNELAVVHRDGSLSQLNLENDDFRTISLLGSCSGLVYDKANQVLIVSNQYKGNGFINFISKSGLKLIDKVAINSTPTCLYLDHLNNKIFVGHNESGVSLINRSTREKIIDSIPNLNFGEIESLFLTPDGKYLLAAAGNNQIMVYQAKDLYYLGNITGHGSKIKIMVFDYDSNTLATGDMTGNIRLIAIKD